MKIDINYKFKTLEGENVKDQASLLKVGELLAIETWEGFREYQDKLQEGKPFTLRKACVNVLLMTELDGMGRAKELKGEEKVERYELAQEIHKSGPLIDLQSEDISLLKKLIARAYGPLTVGQAWEVLDPHGAEKKKAEEKEGETPTQNSKDN